MLEDLRSHPLSVVAVIAVIAATIGAGVTAADLGTQKPGDVPLVGVEVGLLVAMLFMGIGRTRGCAERMVNL